MGVKEYLGYKDGDLVAQAEFHILFDPMLSALVMFCFSLRVVAGRDTRGPKQSGGGSEARACQFLRWALAIRAFYQN